MQDYARGAVIIKMIKHMIRTAIPNTSNSFVINFDSMWLVRDAIYAYVEGLKG